jgi:hypothetical protein
MSPYQQDVIEYNIIKNLIDNHKKVYLLYKLKQFKLVHLDKVETSSREQSINQRATGIEQLYKRNYYNKVLVKLNH